MAVNRLEWGLIWELGFMGQGMGVKAVNRWQWSGHSHGMVLALGWKCKWKRDRDEVIHQ
jgi:hypothetical protein